MPSSTCIASTKVIVLSGGSLANDDMSNQDHERKGRMERLSMYVQQDRETEWIKSRWSWLLLG